VLDFGLSILWFSFNLIHTIFILTFQYNLSAAETADKDFLNGTFSGDS
jgi:hypothetical protein